MKVLVFGAGALGSLMGALLVGKHEVTLIGRAAHVEAIRKDGLKVEGVRKLDVRPVAHTELQGDEEPDLIVLAAKAHGTTKAIAALKNVVQSSTIICTVQNGLGNYEALKEAFPTNPVLAATITSGAMMVAPGRIQYSGQGDIILGGTPHDLGASGVVARVLREAGLRALGVPDIRGPLWQKAIVNAAINPLSAIKDCTNGELLEDAQALERMRVIATEGAAVARALKVPLPEKDVFAVVQRVAKATAANRSSMQQDLAHGRVTEIGSINGALVAWGKKLGVPTPENERLVAEIHRLEAAAA